MVRFFSLVERSGGSTGFVNCNKKLPAIKTNYPMRCLLYLRRSLLKENLSISMQNLIKVFKCEEYQNCTLSEIWNWSRNRKIRHIILSCVPCLCTSNKTSQFHLLEPAESRERKGSRDRSSWWLMIKQMQTSFANDRFVVRSKSSNKEHEHQPTIPLLWSSTIIYMKLKSYSVILVDDNPA